MRKKIALIGGGNIGGTIAYILASKQIADVVILDRNEGFAKGKALDIEQSLSVTKNDISVIGTSDYADIDNADLIIITAGIARKPGMSRDDLLGVNADVMKSVAEGVKAHAPNAFVIIVTNPLDAMVYAFLKHSNFSKEKVAGMAGVLDSARFKLFLSKKLNVSVEDINAFVLGGHGDTMVPLTRHINIAGIPIQNFIDNGDISEEELNSIIERTKTGGAEIVKLLATGSAYYAPAISAIEMAESYLYDKKKLLPCSVLLEGEYGINDICMGVPVIIGKQGIEKIRELHFNEEEKSVFDKSAKAVQDLILAMKKKL
ncbi:MAG: malate dehydrogenase [Candidatus Midichloriaceae bacterium]|jgi:malate dehydrogenase